MKKISIFLVLALVFSALMLPGIAYGKGKPVTSPDKGGLHAVGKPPSTPGSQKNLEGSVGAQEKGLKKGSKKFVLEGTVTKVTLSDSTGTVEVKIVKAGKAIKERLKAKGFVVTDPVEIKVESTTKIRPKNKTLAVGQRVNVKGDIVQEDGKWVLKAKRIVIKPKPFKSED